MFDNLYQTEGLITRNITLYKLEDSASDDTAQLGKWDDDRTNSGVMNGCRHQNHCEVEDLNYKQGSPKQSRISVLQSSKYCSEHSRPVDVAVAANLTPFVQHYWAFESVQLLHTHIHMLANLTCWWVFLWHA